jgi:hypothetical protein
VGPSILDAAGQFHDDVGLYQARLPEAQVEEERKQQSVGAGSIKRWSTEMVDIVPEQQPEPPSSALGWFHWFELLLTLPIMPHQLSLSISIISAPAITYTIQLKVMSAPCCRYHRVRVPSIPS